ncbi:MAG: histidine kinase [Bacteroidota bacterium]|nr:histidine kinase [Bacteroidota bacterium]
MTINIFDDKKRLFFHIAYWIGVVTFFTLLWGTRYRNYWVCFYNELVFLPIKLGMTYFTLYYIIPRLLFRGEYLKTGVASLLTMVGGGLLQRTLVYFSVIPLLGVSDMHVGLFDPTEILSHIINTTSVMIIPVAIKLYKFSLEKENRILLLSQEKTMAELQFLRSQIQPHFFFNVLNDLYAMALKKSDRTPEMILKLSDLMRYVLQESRAEMVPVEKELAYLHNYIDLEKLRYDKRFSVDFEIVGDTSSCRIPPLLLLPFVENAFKHSTIHNAEGAWISIKLEVNPKKLFLKVNNSFDPDIGRKNNLCSGIGIENVRQRLDIIYYGRYSLDIHNTETQYSSTLIINFLDYETRSLLIGG